MAKFLSGRQSNFNIGIKSYTENQTVLQTIGKVGIGTTNAGNYSLYVVGAANITTSVTSPIYYGTSANLTGIVTFGSLWVNGTSRLIGNLQIDGDTNITGNLTIGGTSAYIAASTLTVGDKDIVLGFTTNPTDTTANHGGIAIASTEGSPLISLYSAGINTLPDTYKQFMWVKGGTYGAGTTDAWLSNYAIGIGSTQVPNGVRLAVGGVQITDNTVNATNANLSYISGINLNYSGIGTVVNLYSTNSTLSSLTGTAVTYTTGNFATVTGSNLYYNSGIVTTLSGTTATYNTANITTLSANNGYINTGIVTTLSGTTATYNTVNVTTLNASNAYYYTGIVTTLSGTNLNYSGISTISGVQISSGIITAVGVGTVVYYGDGSHLIGVNAFNVINQTLTSSPVYPTFANNIGVTSIGISTTQIVFVPATGAIGIGTTDPTSKLQVSGDGKFTGVVTATTFSGNINAGVGTITTLSGTSATYTTGNITTLNSTNGYINAGIITTLSGTNLNYSGIGTVVNLYSTNSTLSSLTGTAVTYTSGNITTLSGSNAYYNSGIVTTLSGTTATYTTGNFTTVTGSNLYYNSGIVTSLAGTNLNYSGIGTITTLNSTNSSIASLTGTAATYTTGNFTTVTGSDLYYNSGIVTTLSGTTVTYTTGNITTLNSTNGYINTGIVTTLSGTSATYTTGNITTLNSTNGYINAGIITTLSGTNLNYSGIGTIATLSSTNGTITNLTNTNINASGIITASQFSTGASGVGVNINTNTISGPATIIIDPAAVGDNTGAVRIKGDFYVDGTQTYINSTTLEIADYQIGIGTTASSDLLLDGAGIGIGSTGSRKTFTWDYANSALKSSENLNLASGKTYKINGTDVLSSNTLGSGVVNSSLTSVGTLANLNVSGVSTLPTLNSTNATITNLTGTAVTYTTGNITTLSGTTATYTTGNITTLNSTNGYINTGIVTTLSGTTATYTTGNITTLNSTNGYINTGIVTTLSGTNLNYSGISTLGTIQISSGIVTATSGVVTYYGDGSHLFGVNAFNVINQDITSSPVYPTFASNVGVSSVGISSAKLVFVPASGSLGIGTTNPTSTLDVIGDGRFTGVVTATTFSGNINAGVGTIDKLSTKIATFTTGNFTNGYINTGIVTTLSGTNLNYSGISTISGVQISSGIITAVGVGTVVYYGDGSHLQGVNAFNVINQDITSSPVYPTFASNVGVSSVGISSAKLVFVPASGSLGIGTTNPQYNVDAVGDINSSTAVRTKGIDILEEAMRLAIALG